MKKEFIRGLVAGGLTSVANIIYATIYQETLMLDFSQVVNTAAIIASSVIGCMLMSAGYMTLIKFNKLAWSGWLNIVIGVLSFASILGPISMSLPLDVEFPEMFPGLVIPMHFIPALVFLIVQPFFYKFKEE